MLRAPGRRGRRMPPQERVPRHLRPALAHPPARDARPTHDEARVSIFEYIEVFYNRERTHSTINYMTPVAFQAAWQTEQHKAASLRMQPTPQLPIHYPLYRGQATTCFP